MLLGNITNELNLDCISKLLHYNESFHNYESYAGEYYNLVGQTLAKDGKTAKALEYFNLAREAPVVDQKVLINLELLTFFFKQYLYRLYYYLSNYNKFQKNAHFCHKKYQIIFSINEDNVDKTIDLMYIHIYTYIIIYGYFHIHNVIMFEYYSAFYFIA